MKRKNKAGRLKRNIANLIEVKGVSARPDQGHFQHIKIPVMMDVNFSGAGVFFELSYFNKMDENWGAKFRFGITGKEYIKAFVDFVRIASEYKTGRIKTPPHLIKQKHLTGDPRHGHLMYITKHIWFALVLLDDEVKFTFIFVQKAFDHWGITLNYQIEGEKQTESFVEFILKTYQFLKKQKQKDKNKRR